MRPSRVLAAFLVVAVAAVAVGWRVATSQGAPRPTTHSHHLVVPRELLQPVRPGSGMCFVAGGCSEKPCVLDIQEQQAAMPSGSAMLQLQSSAVAVTASPRRSAVRPIPLRVPGLHPDEVPISGCGGQLPRPEQPAALAITKR